MEKITILYAEDDLEDQMLVKEALEETGLANEITFVNDGEELMDYLRQHGEYAELDTVQLPDLILLDLNMPRKDGREALLEIKSDPRLWSIPITVFTTSESEEDIIRSYDYGVNSFITKPVTFAAMIETMRTFTEYWLQIVKLPKSIP